MIQFRLPCGGITTVDDCDLETICSGAWRIKISGRSDRRNRHQYVLNKKSVGLHRVLVGAKEGEVVDHINGDTLDNRRANLRIVTNAENVRNAKKRDSDTTTSRYKGVGYESRRWRWRATITVDNKTQHLGYFNDELAAAMAYDAASLKLHGDFGRRNFALASGKSS